jgi:hypothetical protein
MERSPLYLRPSKKTNCSDLFRNCWCPNYDTCLNKAAREDLFLDCGACLFKDNIVEEFAISIKKRQ